MTTGCMGRAVLSHADDCEVAVTAFRSLTLEQVSLSSLALTQAFAWLREGHNKEGELP